MGIWFKDHLSLWVKSKVEENSSERDGGGITVVLRERKGTQTPHKFLKIDSKPVITCHNASGVSLLSFKVSLFTSSHFTVGLLGIYVSIDILPFSFFLYFLSLEYASKSFCKYLFISPALKLQRQVTLYTQLGTEHWNPRCSKSLISVFVRFFFEKNSLPLLSPVFTLWCTTSLLFVWNVTFNCMIGEV